MTRPALVVAAVLAFSACSPPKAGDRCSGTQLLCQDAGSALDCRSGVWTLVRCEGQAGCSAQGGTATCDQPKAGDPCNGPGFRCQDSVTAIECRGTAWLGLPCRGDGGCEVNAGVVRCDMNGNRAGDPCASTAEGRGLCTPDGLGTLECRDGVLVKTNTCRSCTVQGDQVICQP